MKHTKKQYDVLGLDLLESNSKNERTHSVRRVWSSYTVFKPDIFLALSSWLISKAVVISPILTNDADAGNTEARGCLAVCANRPMFEERRSNGIGYTSFEMASTTRSALAAAYASQ